ncbi:Sm-like ribonucleo protein, partial [Coprinellus micaceus]
LIFSVFKTLTDQTVTVELKNDLSITGVLKSVDQFLNIRLDNITVSDAERHPHMMAVKNCFIRGSVVRYVQLPAEHVDTQLLEDATRRGLSISSFLHLATCHTSYSCFGSRGGEPGQAVTPQTENAFCLRLDATAVTSGSLEDRGIVIRVLFRYIA